MKDIESFEDAFRTHNGRMYRLAVRLTGNREDAEDLTADVFAIAYDGWQTFRGDASISTWLYGIMLNRWRMLRRKRHPAVLQLEYETEPAADSRYRDLDLERAILALPEPMRVALLLVKGEGLTHAEAAHAIGSPIGTVYFRVFRGVALLRKALAAEPPDRAVIRPEVSHEKGI